jgi:hypothetical protein
MKSIHQIKQNELNTQSSQPSRKRKLNEDYKISDISCSDQSAPKRIFRRIPKIEETVVSNSVVETMIEDLKRINNLSDVPVYLKQKISSIIRKLKLF